MRAIVISITLMPAVCSATLEPTALPLLNREHSRESRPVRVYESDIEHRLRSGLTSGLRERHSL